MILKLLNFNQEIVPVWACFWWEASGNKKCVQNFGAEISWKTWCKLEGNIKMNPKEVKWVLVACIGFNWTSLVSCGGYICFSHVEYLLPNAKQSCLFSYILGIINVLEYFHNIYCHVTSRVQLLLFGNGKDIKYNKLLLKMHTYKSSYRWMCRNLLISSYKMELWWKWKYVVICLSLVSKFKILFQLLEITQQWDVRRFSKRQQ